MKKPILWVLISLICFITIPVIEYCEGRSNSVWVVPPLLPAEMVPLLLMLVSVFVLFFTWLRSLRTKNRSLGKGLMFVASLGLFFAHFAVGRADL